MLRKITLGAAVLTTALVGSSSQADAFWGHSSGGSYGSWGSSGGSYGSSGGFYGSSGGYYGSWGSYGGGGHHHRHHHHRRWAYYGGSSGGSWGSSGGYAGWGSSGGSWGSSGGSWGSSGGVYGGVITTGPAMGGGAMYGAPDGAAPAAPPPHPSDMPADGGLPPGPATDGNLPPDEGAPPPPTDSNTGLSRPSASALLTVRVPANAQVFVNGLPTTSTGTVRRYVSNGLRWGYSYTYHIRAEIVRDGDVITENKTVKLLAGDKSDVEFALNGSNSDPIANQPVRTSVTLHVPADAKVFLSSNETQGSGEVRTFSTTKLTAGQSWGNYVVRVEVERNGRTLSKEETVDIKGGDELELSVDFDAPQVARADQ